MENPDSRPPLGAEVYERIDAALYSVQKRYGLRLNSFEEGLREAYSLAGVLSGGRGLDPPKQPIAMSKCLGAYATELFDIESSFYPQDDGLSVWLENLARRGRTKDSLPRAEHRK